MAKQVLPQPSQLVALCMMGMLNWLCADAHHPTRRLYEDLLAGYNQLIRPVSNHSDRVIVKLSLKLTQLLEINMKHQVMYTNVWIEQKWHDYKLTWDPLKYDGVDMINVPAENIWQPDIVLFNNADGNYEPTLITKALIQSSGEVVWRPPALYKSTCEIDVEWFPFDIQTCILIFGSWTYDGFEVDLRHLEQQEGSVTVDKGIDLSDFYTSVEWDIMKVPASYDNEFDDCCPEPYPRITFNITMRRKTLFYTVNLIIPVVGISFLTLLVFCLPSDSGEKVTLAISILVSITVFFLLLAEIIPASSLAVPLLGKYLLFTMMLITLTICVTVGVLNVHFRSPSTHVMSSGVRSVFIDFLPSILCMKRPTSHDLAEELAAISGTTRVIHSCNGQWNRSSSEPLNLCQKGHYPKHHHIHSCPDPADELATFSYTSVAGHMDGHPIDIAMGIPQDINWRQVKDEATECGLEHGHPFGQCSGDAIFNHPSYHPLSLASHQYSEGVQKAIESILYIADHLKKQDEEHNVIEDWKYVAMVLDRLFLWIFSLSCIIGTCIILLRAPSLYDESIPLDAQVSQIGKVN